MPHPVSGCNQQKKYKNKTLFKIQFENWYNLRQTIILFLLVCNLLLND